MIDTVREIVEEIVAYPKYVFVDDKWLRKVAENISKNPPETKWKAKLPTVNGRELTTDEIIKYEVIAGSINYCYWYGHGSMRPFGASSTKMYQILDETVDTHSEVIFNKGFINTFFYKLVKNRFPLLEERYKHLMDLVGDFYSVKMDTFVLRVRNGMMREALDFLVASYPGYASDLFLKRAQLVIMQLQRLIKPFKDKDIKTLTIPADYQVPKMLHYFGCLYYTNSLLDDISTSTLIPKGSRKEVEIRASTIYACDKIAEYSGTDCVTVDNYLWQMKDVIKAPFHLTITTDY